MDSLHAGLARLAIQFLRWLSLRRALQVGRWLGALAFALDARHRKAALVNLRAAFPTLSPAEHVALARENFRRIGETFVAGVCTAVYSDAQIREVLEVIGIEKLTQRPGERPSNLVVAIGHFGNFELFAHLQSFLPGYTFATTYRAVRPDSVNQILLDLRQSSGCVAFERRTDAMALRAALNAGGLVLGLLSDQSGGRHGLPGPFLGVDCTTAPAAPLLALRYHAPLFTAFCYRQEPARWRIEIGDEIPTYANGQPRSVEELTREMNQAFEAAVRRDPANWFWVHDRWRLQRIARRK
jgi:KDO2-lipid IV(A) lauroyltransferase